MIILNLGSWNHCAKRKHTYERIYIHKKWYPIKYGWTPFVRRKKRVIACKCNNCEHDCIARIKE